VQAEQVELISISPPNPAAPAPSACSCPRPAGNAGFRRTDRCGRVARRTAAVNTPAMFTAPVSRQSDAVGGYRTSGKADRDRRCEPARNGVVEALLFQHRRQSERRPPMTASTRNWRRYRRARPQPRSIRPPINLASACDVETPAWLREPARLTREPPPRTTSPAARGQRAAAGAAAFYP